MKKVITRFPPSPTGYLHVGGARTALFNWLYTRHMKGTFILRIEDTDMERSTQASVNAIFEALEWLGIDWDEGPYYQSKRMDLYREYNQKLVDLGCAYFCTCSPEELDEMRKKAMAAGEKPRYNGTCREKGLAAVDGSVIRFKAPAGGTTVVEDVIKGNIVFQNSELDDFIIQRSDRTPTYNLAVAVDDITMNINTVIRGDDHINNTPKQMLIYQALKAPLPIFGHVPMVLGKDKARLSKRHGAMSVTAYRDMGYLPEALLNYLVRLGWSYGDQEFFTMDELIDKFTLDNIGKSAGIFDQEKLLSLSADHIKAADPERLSKYLMPFLQEQGCNKEKTYNINGIIKTLNARSKTLKEMAESALFYFQDKVIYDAKSADKFLNHTSAEPLKLLCQGLNSIEKFTEKNLEDAFKAVMDKTGLGLGKIAQPVRIALTGKTVSPGIFEVIEVLGKERTLQRLNDAIQYISEKHGE
ncbi:MAG: glutamate--tRNA ligase [Deltaproteobacteria bacterium]|nr:glutamate--tRNA ligase [Deltaproteobacteria bacterium]